MSDKNNESGVESSGFYNEDKDFDRPGIFHHSHHHSNKSQNSIILELKMKI